MTKPLVFNYKHHEELREAYKALLEDNQKLMADNRNLREKVRHQAKRVNQLLMENTNLTIDSERNKTMYDTAASIISVQADIINTYHRTLKLQQTELDKLRREVIK